LASVSFGFVLVRVRVFGENQLYKSWPPSAKTT